MVRNGEMGGGGDCAEFVTASEQGRRGVPPLLHSTRRHLKSTTRCFQVEATGFNSIISASSSEHSVVIVSFTVNIYDPF